MKRVRGHRYLMKAPPIRTPLSSLSGATFVVHEAMTMVRNVATGDGRIGLMALLFVRCDPFSRKWFDIPRVHLVQSTVDHSFRSELQWAAREGRACGAVLIGSGVSVTNRRRVVVLTLAHRELDAERTWVAPTVKGQDGYEVLEFIEYETEDRELRGLIS